jgi:quinoprotein glucose dehydrogenase
MHRQDRDSDPTLALRMVSVLLAICFLSIGLTFSWSAAPATALDQSVRSGVYTAGQARRGQQQYDVFCTNCHGVEMEGAGVDVPSLAEPRFVQKWSGRSLRDLFDLIKTTMPENAPGSLDDRAYVDVLAYILQANGFPVGSQSLDADGARLSAILIVPPDQ